MERDSNIELFRCFCMFAVVFGHVVVNNDVASMRGYLWHIPGFLLITGYFGASFSLAKIIKLLGVVYGCYWLTEPLRHSCGFSISLLLPHGGWFVPFYIVLLILSPIFNAALCNDSLGGRRLIYAVIVLLFVAWIPTLSSNVHMGMLRIPGFQGNGILLMVATYFIGRQIRHSDFAHKGRFLMWFLGFIICVAVLQCEKLSFLSSNGYVSPFVLFTATLGFVTFLHLPTSMGIFGRVINFISPSMFGVYILHECCLKEYQYFNEGSAFVHAIIVFSVCVGIDMIRRVMVHLLGLCIAKARAHKSNCQESVVSS